MGAPGINGNNQFPNPSINHTEGRRSEGDDDKLVKKKDFAWWRTHARTHRLRNTQLLTMDHATLCAFGITYHQLATVGHFIFC